MRWLLESIARNVNGLLARKESTMWDLKHEIEVAKGANAAAEARCAKLEAESRRLQAALLQKEEELRDQVAKGYRDVRQAEQANHILRAQIRMMQVREPTSSSCNFITKDEILTRMAQLECAPLGECPAEEQAVLRRRILSKWHPDRQPSEGHRELATRVFQELQTLMEPPP